MNPWYGKIKKWQIIALLLLIWDFVSVISAYGLALYLRFDCKMQNIPQNYLAGYKSTIFHYAWISLVFYLIFKLYNRNWRYVSYVELMRCIVACAIPFAGYWIILPHTHGRLPISYHVFGGFLQGAFLLASRFSYRFYWLLASRYFHDAGMPRESAMLIGGGSAGQLILRDLQTTEQCNIRFHCIIDDDPNKRGTAIEGIPVIGGRERIKEAVERYGINKIYVALPRATPKQRVEILDLCKETGCPVKVLPGIYQFSNNEVSLAKMRDIQIEDLLERQPIVINSDEIFANISGHVILVTGGGGSIGSELCRQIARHAPKELIIFDIYENNAYDIQQELRHDYPDLNLTVLIGSVRDSRRVEAVFAQYHPELVFHAAAHKHVPLMEDSPCEAIKNNVLGTYKVAYAALLYGCRRFLLISTDKAVNPTNIMGASKRICEMVIQTMDKVARTGDLSVLPHLDSHHGAQPNVTPLPNGAHTEFVAVRFGNVLGSNGSVIPLFRKQIANGGPVTVTDPRIIRYFMTIPEAVSLILQSATYAHGGEIFVLDMGDPVKIDTLARNLIKLSGFKPDVDIKVEYTGLRPGEKLYEEKLMSEEGLKKTANNLIHIAEPIQMDTDEFLKHIDELAKVSANNSAEVKKVVAATVPTYHCDV